MGNCLVTKLKSVVDNDNLDVLGMMKLSGHGNLYFKNPNPVHIKAISGTFTIDGNAGQTEAIAYPKGDSTSNYLVIPNDGAVEISKYGYTVFMLSSCVGTNIENLMWNDSLTVLAISGTNYPKMDISKFAKLSSLPNLRIEFWSNLTGKLSSISDMALTSLQLNYCLPIGGAIEELGKNTALTQLKLVGDMFTGSIEEFVRTQVAYNRTSCDNLQLWCNDSGALEPANVKFNNTPVKVSAFKTLSWTPKEGNMTTITFDGVSVDIAN